MKKQSTQKLKSMLAFIMTLALVLAPAVDVVRAQDGVGETPPEQLVRRVTVAAEKFLGVENNRIIISDVQLDEAWATGYVVVTGTDVSDPDLYVFVAQNLEGKWRVAIEGQDRFQTVLKELPESLRMPYPFIDETLNNEAVEFTESNTMTIATATPWVEQPELSFPWTQGYSWKLTGGPHNNSGASTRPWSALDFSPGTSGKWEVRSAAAGTVQISTSCKNYVQINHPGGWQTGYYHLTNITVTNGQYVNRGAYLGKASIASGCGGSATGAHVHFSLRKNGIKQAWTGRYIGGYYVKEGTSQYLGKLQHVVTGASIAVGSNVKNNGYIGLGIPAIPTAYSPEGVVTDLNVTFSWGSAKGSQSYSLEIASDELFSSIVHTEYVTTTSIIVSGLAEGTYYWRVRGENFSHTGSWSTVKTFTIDPNGTPTPPDPIVVNPVLTPAFGSTCTTAWYRVTGTGYGGTNVYLTMNTNVSSQSTNSAIWRPNIPLAGHYKVEAYIGHHTAFTWPCTPQNYLPYDTSQARYKIYPLGTSVYINQKPLDNVWALLGEFYFDTGTSGYVQLKDFNSETNLSRSISFNVVRFTWVGP